MGQSERSNSPSNTRNSGAIDRDKESPDEKMIELYGASLVTYWDYRLISRGALGATTRQPRGKKP